MEKTPALYLDHWVRINIDNINGIIPIEMKEMLGKFYHNKPASSIFTISHNQVSSGGKTTEASYR